MHNKPYVAGYSEQMKTKALGMCFIGNNFSGLSQWVQALI
jgi:hypothetical protein